MCLSDHDDLKYVFRAGTVDTLADVFLWNDRISGRNPFQKGILKARKVDLCIYGFLSVFLIFGGIMNPASILMAYGYITKKSLIAFYISGAPVDLVQATSTVIFLWILSRPLLEKLERVKRKYGLLQRPENKEENEYDKE